MTELHRYRDKNTGMVVDLYDWQASVFPETLERVADNAKPKAVITIHPDAIEGVRKVAEATVAVDETHKEKDK